MLEIIIAALVFAYVARRERKKTTGSVGLMAVVVVGIWVGGYMATVFLLGDLVAEVGDLAMVAILYGWGAVGFGTYWFISKRRESSYQEALDLDDEW